MNVATNLGRAVLLGTIVAGVGVLSAFAAVGCGVGGIEHSSDDTLPDGGGAFGTGGDSGCAVGADNQEGCACWSPGATASCWTGPHANRGVGTCKDGTQTCQGEGEFQHWSPCSGEVLGCGTTTSGTSDSCAHLAISSRVTSTVCVLTPSGSVNCAPAQALPFDAGNASPSLSGVQCISGGENFFCAVTGDGGVTCWGDSGAFDPAKIVQAPLSVLISDTVETLAIPGLESGVVDIAAGETHVCVRMATGAVMCWGNGSGELNYGSVKLDSSPTAVPGLDAVTAIAAGDGFSCALQSDGAVLCWGNNVQGELGDGTTTDSATPVAVRGLPSPAVGIWADQATHPCALLKDGGVWCWGTIVANAAPASAPVQVTGFGAPVSSLTTANELNESCALLTTGGVQCWGIPTTDGSSASAPIDVLPAGSDVIELRGWDEVFCALTKSGAVTCWSESGPTHLVPGL